jgi:hypothetical protein
MRQQNQPAGVSHGRCPAIVCVMVLFLCLSSGAVYVFAVEPSPLQLSANEMMKNIEDMMAHGGMGDAKAIVHHCSEASLYAEKIKQQLALSDATAQEARSALDEVILQCRRVSERGVHADPGALLNPASKAQAAARVSIKLLGLGLPKRS